MELNNALLIIGITLSVTISLTFVFKKYIINIANKIEQFIHITPQTFIPKIQGLAGHFNGRSVELKPDEQVAIGREPDLCQILYPNEQTDISRKHCVIKYDKEKQKFIIMDCNSSNGTFLGNGEQLVPNREYYLEPGDKFYLSDKKNIFKLKLGNE